MRFLHVTTHPKGVNKKKFKNPRIHSFGGLYQHDFNMDGAFYLSKADENDSSMWLKYRELLKKYPNPPYYKYDKKKNEYIKLESNNSDNEDQWLNGKKQFFDVDFKKHNIYVVDNPNDLKDFFVKYGYFVERGRSDVDKRLKYFRKLKIINNFIDNLDNDNKSKIINTEKINNIKNIRNTRNMPYVDFRKNNVVIPKNKNISFEFLVDVIRTKEFFEKEVGDIMELRNNIYTYIRGINFPKMVKDGYNGIYYTTNLIKFISEEKINKIYKSDYDPATEEPFRHSNLFEPVDIGDFPNVLGNASENDLIDIKKSIEGYVKWLGSDTLILWKWVF